MDEAAAVRGAALDALRDVTPPGLRDDLEGFVADGSLVPGVVTLATAAAAGADAAAQTDRAAGVQLIYDGLRLTRGLARENPWAADDARGDEAGSADASVDVGPTTTAADADMAILAADVLVARGFYLLAATDAATDAVEVVRAFGRDETVRRDTSDPELLDRQLEADVLHLALVAGATADGGRPTNAEGLVDDLAASCDGQFPDPSEVVDDRLRERLAAVAGGAGRPLNRND